MRLFGESLALLGYLLRACRLPRPIGTPGQTSAVDSDAITAEYFDKQTSITRVGHTVRTTVTRRSRPTLSHNIDRFIAISSGMRHLYHTIACIPQSETPKIECFIQNLGWKAQPVAPTPTQPINQGKGNRPDPISGRLQRTIHLDYSPIPCSFGSGGVLSFLTCVPALFSFLRRTLTNHTTCTTQRAMPL